MITVGLAGLTGCPADDGEGAESGASGSSTGDASASETGPGTASATEGGSQGTDSTGSTTDSGETVDPDTGNAESGETGIDPGEDAEKIEIRVGDYTVPTTETYYACFEFSMTLDQLGHIIAFDPKIDNASHVHHFVLSIIDGPSGNSDGYSCFDLDGDILWAWAPGQGAFELPEEAGFLIGDAPGGELTLRLQVHYNNPLNQVGEIDNSGFDMWITKNLRPENAGTLVFGDIMGINIPPGEEAYEHVMTCRSEVTASQFVEPLNVFGSSMHAHEIGSVLYTEVWRDGQMVMELNRDDPYVFDSQHIKFIDAVLEPGDEIRNHCIYDSTDRTEPTLGGVGTADEMCWNTVIYYPKIPSGFDYCTSFN